MLSTSGSDNDGGQTEISFSMVTTPAAVLDGLSPFNLVFGDKPHMSTKDVCFPRKFVSTALRDRSQGDPPKVRESFDQQSEGTSLPIFGVQSGGEGDAATRPRPKPIISHSFGTSAKGKTGHRCCHSQPTTGLCKLRYQWSETTYLVIEASPNACTVINLVSKFTV